jgi:hypothetical protein
MIISERLMDDPDPDGQGGGAGPDGGNEAIIGDVSDNSGNEAGEGSTGTGATKD